MKTKTFLIFALIALVAGTISTASADSYFDCAKALKGKKIKWMAVWDSDRMDDETVYKVTNVSEIDRIPVRQVTLDLVAVGRATLKHRRAVIDKEERARAICEREARDVSPLVFPDPFADDLESLPYIRYTKDGWVRGERITDVALVRCRIGEMSFSCTEADRQRFGNTLKTLEDDLRAQVPAQ